MTTPQTITDLAQRVAALESAVTRRVGVIVPEGRDLLNMEFVVRLIDGDAQSLISGVRLLYMRQSAQLSTLLVPEEGETVVLERLGTGWVIVGSYGHDLAGRTVNKPPLGADWVGRRNVPFDIQAHDSAIQLTAVQESPLSGVDVGSDAIVHLGKTRDYGGGDDTDVLAVIMTSRHFTRLEGYNVELNPDGIYFIQLQIDSPTSDPRFVPVLDTVSGKVVIAYDPADPGAMATAELHSRDTGSAGLPSHQHSIPSHSHVLPLYATQTVTVIEERR